MAKKILMGKNFTKEKLETKVKTNLSIYELVAFIQETINKGYIVKDIFRIDALESYVIHYTDGTLEDS